MKRMKKVALSLLSVSCVMLGASCVFPGGGGGTTSVTAEDLLAANQVATVLATNGSMSIEYKSKDHTGAVVDSRSYFYATTEDDGVMYEVRDGSSVTTYVDSAVYSVSDDAYAVEIWRAEDFNDMVRGVMFNQWANIPATTTISTVNGEVKMSYVPAESTTFIQMSVDIYFDATTKLATKYEKTTTNTIKNQTSVEAYTYAYDTDYVEADGAKAKHIANKPVTMTVCFMSENDVENTIVDFVVSRDSKITTQDGYSVYKSNEFTCDAENFKYLDTNENAVTVFFTEKHPDISFVYTLTEEHYAAYQAALEIVETELVNSGDREAIETNLEIVVDSIAYYRYQYAIAQCNYYLNMRDTTVKSQYEYALDVIYGAIEAYQDMCKAVYNSDSSYWEEFFEGWTEEDFASLGSSGEGLELERRMKEIEDEFETLGAINWEQSVKDLYVEYVDVATEYANFYGYDNYYEFAMVNRYNRDYTLDDLADFRAYAKEYLVPVLHKVDDIWREAWTKLRGSLYEQAFLNFIQEPSALSISYVEGFIESLPTSLRERCESLFTKEGALLFSKSEHAMAGAYTSYISKYEEAYVFIGNGYDNVYTLVHEMGHYASAYSYDFSALDYDFAETHSQGCEWLLTAHMKRYFASDWFRALYSYNLYNAMISTMISILIDEFEYAVYTAETPYTADELDGLMESIFNEYGIQDENVTLDAVQNYWKRITLGSPVYYISYATSQIASINFFVLAENEGYDVAAEAYRKLQEDGDLSWGFVGNLTAAGVTSPFDEVTHINLYEFFFGPIAN